jgi:transcription-repair coupling factor (superfamily II helicase)
MRDLELRGAGNLLGAQQSGHIASVGYDLYCRLLADAVRAAKKDLPAPSPLAALDVELPCGVPTSYVKDPRETFRIFRRVASATTLDLLSELRAEVEGRFGPPPPDTKRLFLHQAVRILAGSAGVVRVAPAEAGGLVLEANDPRALDRLEVDLLPRSAGGVTLRRLEPRRAYFPPPPSAPAGDVPRALAAAVERLEAVLLARAPVSGGQAAFPGPRPHG